MENRKELVIALADAEQEAVAAVNAIMQKNGLPCYLMEPIIDKIHLQLRERKAAELAEAINRAKISQADKPEDASREESCYE